MKNVKSKRGFTIIEVVLVLAIAGLIFLMVFLALPALQRGQRDTQRRSALSAMVAQVTNYSSSGSNRGKVPSTQAQLDSFKKSYLTGDQFLDPSSGSEYKLTFSKLSGATPGTTPGDVTYGNGVLCGDGGSLTTSGANARNYAFSMRLENGIECQDNRG